MVSAAMMAVQFYTRNGCLVPWITWSWAPLTTWLMSVTPLVVLSGSLAIVSLAIVSFAVVLLVVAPLAVVLFLVALPLAVVLLLLASLLLLVVLLPAVPLGCGLVVRSMLSWERSHWQPRTRFGTTATRMKVVRNSLVR